MSGDVLSLAAEMSPYMSAAAAAYGGAVLARARDEAADAALTRFRRILGDGHPNTLRCIEELAADLRATGDLQAANEFDEEALAGYQAIFGDNHPRAMEITHRLNHDKTTPGTAATG